MLVTCAVTAANANDTLVFQRMFLAAYAATARIRTVLADKGYDAERRRDLAADSAPNRTSTIAFDGPAPPAKA